ncbi:hypothetical protein K458DRAFT_422121 [Lentithecium fluviatile CBS 122367]|uniref:DUF676 domain-containing protein n=1 Tax=Lentithecium fluviatile CBS 122367 TaxID=1168545 RepID=A0A6G1INP0_9PLEO|nr:hypothetical protein K458DRAFT_422121 [Lentithecium fluviatile CBS 122367]
MADDHTFLEIVADPPAANLDIIAIHGLNPFHTKSNAESTWTAKKGDVEKNWIKDKEFLPKLLPSARIMIFGYNSHAVFGAAAATINDHASTLLEKIRLKRRKVPATRSIVFICHSLGGLLAKRALLIATLPKSIYQTIYTCTGGMVFFATPHGGSGKARIGKIASTIARTLTWGRDNAFMEALSKNSLCSEATRTDFNDIVENIRLISYFETLPTSGTMVVDKEDAVCGLPREKELKLLLNANHSEVCKFLDPEGKDYVGVSEQIDALVEDVLKDAARRTSSEAVGLPTAGASSALALRRGAAADAL